LVWDRNHTWPEQVADVQPLASKMSRLHLSDTRLLETDEHLPIRSGTIDFSVYLRELQNQSFTEPAIF
jgi:sugar phosphate isomerase/epimerase